MRVLTSRLRKVERLAFAPDGQSLYASGFPFSVTGFTADTGIDVWELAGGPEPAHRLLEEWPIGGFVLSPDGRRLYAAGRALVPIPSAGYVGLDLATRAVDRFEFHAWLSFALAVSPDSRRVVAYGHKAQRLGWSLSCWNQPARGERRLAWEQRLPSPDIIVLAVAFHPDGQSVLCAGWRRARRERQTQFVTRSADTGQPVGHPVTFPNSEVGHLALTPDGTRFAVVSGMSLFSYDATDPAARPVKSTNDNRKHFTGIAFHPSGKYLAATSNDTTVKLYDAATWRVAKTFTWKVGKLRSVAFSPDGTVAAVGGDKGQVVVWDVDL
jgi:WD40 repeat protein